MHRLLLGLASAFALINLALEEVRVIISMLVYQ